MMSRSVKRNQTLLLLGFCCLSVGVFIGLSVSRFGFLSKCGVEALRASSIGAPPQLAHTCSKYVRPGTETLAPGIVEAYTDLFLRRLWGNPDEDIPYKAKYLLVLTVGIQQKEMVNKAVSKFNNKDFMIVLFHYDGHVDGWDEYEWSQRAVHYAARKQTKWWYAKRFLHPDVVRDYEYIFLWDEDLDLEHFDPVAYLDIVKKHGLEISQPGLEDTGLTWTMTRRIGGSEVHKQAEERPGWCGEGPQKPPCAAFVEIMAPVFSRTAWRCVWHLVQNDLVHGWGLDFSLQKCVTPAHEKIGVVDAQWIRHQGVPSLGNQGEATDGNEPWRGVRARCRLEWKVFADRLQKAEEIAKNTTTTTTKTTAAATTATTGTNTR